MIADLLQAQPLSKEVRRASVAKTMGAVRGSLDAQCVQSAADHVIKATWRKATKRGLERHKQISRGATPWPGPPEIVQNCDANRLHDWVVLCLALLGAFDRDDFS